MELYDKKYVYFEWDDKLEGKDVFCATSIEDLKSQVNYGNAQTGILHHSNNPKGHPFVPTWSDGSGSIAYPFAYYDPNYEVKKAYFKDGKKLQWKYRSEKNWYDWDNGALPQFHDDTTGYELRVKPETVEYKEPEKDRHLTNKELAMWLAQGKGLAMDKGTGRKSTSYDYWEEDKTVDYMNLAVRKWNDTKWNYPTYGYCFGDK